MRELKQENENIIQEKDIQIKKLKDTEASLKKKIDKKDCEIKKLKCSEIFRAANVPQRRFHLGEPLDSKDDNFNIEWQTFLNEVTFKYIKISFAE